MVSTTSPSTTSTYMLNDETSRSGDSAETVELSDKKRWELIAASDKTSNGMLLEAEQASRLSNDETRMRTLETGHKIAIYEHKARTERSTSSPMDRLDQR